MKKTTYEGAVCSHRHSFSLDNFFRKLIQSPKKIVGPYIKPGDTVIDLGCGPGFFTVPMAKMVGDTGKVIAVDLQREMLDILAEKLSDSHLAHRVQLHRCSEKKLELDKSVQADFILAYYMLHETPDQRVFFGEVQQVLKPDGRILVVEPPFHVNRSAFLHSRGIAEEVGFTVMDTPRRKGGMSMLLSH